MSRYSAIKAATDAYIKTNGRQEITGAILNAVMNATIDSLGRFYQFVGSAVPTTDPGTIDQNIAYLASTPGTYTNLGGLSVDAGEFAVLKFDGQWKKDVVVIVPSKVSQLENDLGYITNAVSDLVHYYTKTETDTALANFYTKPEVQSILANYYDKDEVESLVSAITQQSYVVAWDGTAEPVVSDIPAGVSVTWGGNPYVGTLPASASTINKIYLVSNGAGYDEYITTDNSGYAWVAIGTTALDLSGYATTAELSQLDAIVNGTDETTEVLLPKSLTADKYFNTNVSTMASSPSDNVGFYCVKVSVVPGEHYRIKGLQGTSVYTLLFATADSDRHRLRRADTGSNTRTTLDVTIEEGEAYLYVNLGSYDSQTDGAWKVTEVTEHTDGLVDDVQDLDNRVTDLENATGVNVVDSLDSTSTTDALSANKGRVLNEDINGVTTISYVEQEILVGRYCNTMLSQITSKTYLPEAEGVACVYAYVRPGDVFRIYGKGNAYAYQLYAMADSERNIVENGKPGVAMNTRNDPLELTIPEGVARLCVNLQDYDPLTDKVEKRTATTTECVKTRLTALEEKSEILTSLSLPLSGKKVMVFGDSIFDFTYDEKGLTDYLREYSLANVLKGAIGGTRLVQRASPVLVPTTTTQAYAALDICNIVKAWCEAEYTKQDAAVAYLNNYSDQIDTLKANPVSGVDFVIIGGGTNDITNQSPIGTETDNGFTTLWGSFNEMVNLLLTANPKLKIFFASPIVGYRASARTDSNWDDNYVYASGKTKPQYIELFSQMAGHSHIPYLDLYFTAGVNQVNFSEYFLDSDNRHPYKGFDLYARRLYQRLLANLM